MRCKPLIFIGCGQATDDERGLGIEDRALHSRRDTRRRGWIDERHSNQISVRSMSLLVSRTLPELRVRDECSDIFGDHRRCLVLVPFYRDVAATNAAAGDRGRLGSAKKQSPAFRLQNKL